MFLQTRNLLFGRLVFFMISLFTLELSAASYYTLTGASGSYTSYNGSYYKESYQILSRPVYKHGTQNYYIYFDNTFGNAWFIDNNTTGYPSAFFKWSNDNYPPEGKYEIDYAYDSNEPTLTKVMNAQITFTDGSTFTPNIIKGSANQVFGRFQLTGDEAGASLTAASIKLYGECTGLSNFKLWSSADAAFNSGSDTQLGSTIAANPGDGGSASSSSFSSAIGTGGMYYFLTADVTAGATGTVLGVIVSNANLTLASGALSGTITNAPLSNGDVSLPVALASFTAQVKGNTIILNWTTASETDNLGFTLERSLGNGEWIEIASYRTCDALKGQGHKSTTTNYSWTDAGVAPNSEYRYRLADVNTAGMVTMHSPIAVTITALPQSTAMLNAYPNPFNPETSIQYNLHQDSQVTITVYDLLGRKVKILIDEQQATGSYHTIWNGTDAAGAQAASGAYIIRMATPDSNPNAKSVAAEITTRLKPSPEFDRAFGRRFFVIINILAQFIIISFGRKNIMNLL